MAFRVKKRRVDNRGASAIWSRCRSPIRIVLHAGTPRAAVTPEIGYCRARSTTRRGKPVRIAFLPDGHNENSAYRSLGPMRALAARGHEVRELEMERIDSWHDLLRWCDVLHLHRVCDRGSVELVRAAKAAGATVVWDDDDDVTRVPKGTPGYREAGGAKGQRRLAARTRMFGSVDLVTAPSAHLAETFRAGGAPETRVIENYVIDDFVRAGPSRGPLRIGWVAAGEHRLDLSEIPIVDALQRLLDAHPDVHVTTIGIRLDLNSDRYEHVPNVPLPRLIEQVARFSIGIAPLSPALPINLARSNVKLKEYTAAGVPWLASPIGPYADLGEREGGRLVPDERWFEELDALVRSDRARRRLAKRAARWGRSQLLSRNVELWEQAFERARAARAPAAA
jgi:glycosyltransferase involved in cell wall biosynthesis